MWHNGDYCFFFVWIDIAPSFWNVPKFKFNLQSQTTWIFLRMVFIKLYYWHFLVTSYFGNTLFPKMMPNFWRLIVMSILKRQYLSLCSLWAKNRSNFLPLPWKLNNRCYHTFKTRYTNTLKFSKQIITCCTIFTRLWGTFIYVNFTICTFKSIFTITGVRRIKMICTGNSVCLWTWVWLAWTVEFIWAIIAIFFTITKFHLFNTFQR